MPLRRELQEENDFKVGDIVTVRNWGYAYSSYTSYFDENDMSGVSLKDIARYEYGNFNRPESLDTKFKILQIGTHEITNKAIAFIELCEPDKFFPTYLIGVEGLGQVRKKMTLEDIEEKLGYKIELV